MSAALAALHLAGARFPVREVLVGDDRWQIQDTGVRPGTRTLVLLPGSVGDARLFSHQLLALGDRMRVMAATYPPLLRAEALCASLKHLLAQLGVRDAVVLGSSFAAWWLQAWPGDRERRVALVVLANGFVAQTDLGGNALFDPAVIDAHTPESLKAFWVARVAAGAESPLKQVLARTLADQRAETLHSRFATVSRAAPLRALARSRVPTALVHCRDDPLIGATAFDAMCAAHPGAKRVVLDCGGHYPAVLAADRYTVELADLVDHAPHAVRAAPVPQEN